MLAAGAVLIYAVLTLAAAVQGVGCEGQAYAMLQTVRCDGERGHSWIVAQEALVVLGGAGLLAGIGWSLRTANVRWLVAAGVFCVVGFVIVGQIGEISLAAKPLPRLSGFQIIDRRCPDLCAGGLRVAFTSDRTAPIWFDFNPDLPNTSRDISDYQYLPELVGSTAREPTSRSQMDFGPGGHVVRIELVKRTRDEHRARPLKPGSYALDITASVENPGNQSEVMTGASRTFTILPVG